MQGCFIVVLEDYDGEIMLVMVENSWIVETLLKGALLVMSWLATIPCTASSVSNCAFMV